MNQASREVAKWVAAVVVLTGVVIYAVQALPGALGNSVEVGEDAASPSASASATASPSAAETVAASSPDPALQGPVSDGNVQPTVDLSLDDGVVTGVGSKTLTIGSEETDAIVLSFPLIKGDPECVGGVRLEIAVEDATPTELGVAPSALFTLDTLDEGAVAPPALLDPAPGTLAFTNGSPGRLPWDVTDLYRTWASGTPFPGGESAPPRTPFTLAVRATSPGTPDREVVFSAEESGEDGPTLSWIGLPGCDGGA